MKSSRPGSTGRLIALLGIFAVIPLILLVALPLRMATSTLGNEAKSRVADTASVNANAVSLQMQNLAGVTQSYSGRPELVVKTSIPYTKANNPTLEALTELHSSNTNIRTAFMLNAAGQFVVGEGTSAATKSGTDFSYREYYKGAVGSSDVYVAGAVLSVSQPPVKIVTVSKAIRGPADITGQEPLIGVLVVSVDVTRVFQSYVDDFKAKSGVSTSIVDGNDGLVAAPGLSNTVPVVKDSLVGAIRNKSTSASSVKRNSRTIVAYSPVAGTNWVLTASVPAKEALAPVDQFRTRVLVIAAILGTVIAAAFVLLIRSVRGRERAVRDVRLSEERTRKVVETVRQAFCELDLNMNITDWNTQAEKLLGWKREEVWGKNFIDLFIPIERREIASKAIRSLIEQSEEAGQTVGLGKHLISKDNEAIPVDVNMWATEVAGRRRINIFAQDISERVRLEREQELVVKRQRRLVEELRTADKAKTDFISTISHELRTPLTSIVGYLEMLNDGYGGELSNNQSSMLDVIDRNSRRLLSLIEDVLTLSRIESGAFKGRAIAIEVTALVQTAVQTFVPVARTKSLEVNVDVPKEVGWIRGDQGQLERVLLNIISNAVKFTPEQGKVTVHGYKSDDKVTISVSDTGIGIPVEEQHRLFSRFFRASTAQDHAIQGTGLGLTIVKSIVERHGGTINVQSSDGNGTTVILEFPAVGVDTPVSVSN